MKGYLALPVSPWCGLKGTRAEGARSISLSPTTRRWAGTGVAAMIASSARRSRPAPVFVGEPSNMTVVDEAQGPGALARRAHRRRRIEHAAYGVKRNCLRRPADRRDPGDGGGAEGRTPHPALSIRRGPPHGDSDRRRHRLQRRAGAVLFGWETRALPGFDPFTLQRRLEKFAAEQCLPEMQRLAPESRSRYG